MALYAGHIPRTVLQNCLLALGSAVVAIRNPYRHDMVAVCGETTGSYALPYMRKKMVSHEVGCQILDDQPRINTSSVNFKQLRELPDDTLGKQYVDMMDKYKITPDSRLNVRFVDDPDLAYVMQRYREVHDFNHLLLGQPTNMLGEVIVKWFEAMQTGLPMCYMAAIAGPARLSSSRRVELMQKLPWIARTANSADFFMNVYYEKEFDVKIDDVRRRMGIDLND